MKEIWKDIENYESLYQVSNLGNVKSCGKYVWNRFQYIYKVEKILKPRYDKKGYTQVALYKNNIPHNFKIHRLVLNAFIPNIYNKEQVNHINGIKDDNRLCNLEWATQSENQNHAFKLGLCNKKIELIVAKFSKPVAMYNENNKLLKVFPSAADANRYFNVKYSHICAVCNGYRKKAFGYKWNFISKDDYFKLKDELYDSYKIIPFQKQIKVFDINGKYIKTFLSSKEASKNLNIKQSSIRKVCRGERKSCKGYIFKY